MMVFAINTIRMRFVTPVKKVNKLKKLIEYILADFPFVHVKTLSQLAGFINSLALALGSRLFSR